jgi:hypothetical protein
MGKRVSLRGMGRHEAVIGPVSLGPDLRNSLNCPGDVFRYYIVCRMPLKLVEQDAAAMIIGW